MHGRIMGPEAALRRSCIEVVAAVILLVFLVHTHASGRSHVRRLSHPHGVPQPAPRVSGTTRHSLECVVASSRRAEASDEHPLTSRRRRDRRRGDALGSGAALAVDAPSPSRARAKTTRLGDGSRSAASAGDRASASKPRSAIRRSRPPHPPPTRPCPHPCVDRLQMDRRSAPDRPRIDSEMTPDRPRIDPPQIDPVRPGIGPRSTQDRPNIDLGSPPDRPQIDPMLTPGRRHTCTSDAHQVDLKWTPGRPTPISHKSTSNRPRLDPESTPDRP